MSAVRKWVKTAPSLPEIEIQLTRAPTAEEADAFASPARALQAKLEQAALRSFYAPTQLMPLDGSLNELTRLVIVAAIALASWAAVFGAAFFVLG